MENRLRSEYRSSFFSPQVSTAMGGEEDVRRSRIQHLPSHRRGDLSGRLDFVVVFQTVEIQRLSTEVEALRVKLKDSERQIRNSLSYEVQIRELTENCYLLEQRQMEYQRQVEQMSLACNALYEELADAQRQKDREVEASNAKGTQLSSANQQLTQRVAGLQQELRKSKESEKEAERKGRAAAQEAARLGQVLAENEEKMAKKGSQFAKLQQDLKNWQETQRQERERAMNALREEKRQLVDEVAQQRAQAAAASNFRRQLQNSKRENDFLRQEMDNLKDQFFRLRNEHKSNTSALNQSQQANQQLTRQLKGISNEISKEKDRSQQLADLASELKAKIEAKTKDLQGVKRNLMDYDRELKSKNDKQTELIRKIQATDSIFAQNNNLQDQIFRLNGKLVEMEGEKNQKGQQVMDLALDNKELQQRVRQLESASQRSSNELRLLQERMEKNRQQFDAETKRIAGEYQKALSKEGEEKRMLATQAKQLEKEIQVVKQQGLVKEELRNEMKKLAENIRKQEKDIQTLANHLQNAQEILKKLKEKYAQMNELGKANSILRQQLDASFALNDRMIQKIGAYEQDIEALTDQNWRLTDRLREDALKDDFSTVSSAKTATSLRYSNVQLVKPFQTLPDRSFIGQQSRPLLEGIRYKEPGPSLGLSSSGWRR